MVRKSKTTATVEQTTESQLTNQPEKEKEVMQAKSEVKTKLVKYVCHKCGVTVKAPEGFVMNCIVCDQILSKAPTSKKELEEALCKAYERVKALTGQVEVLEIELQAVGKVYLADEMEELINNKNNDDEFKVTSDDLPY